MSNKKACLNALKKFYGIAPYNKNDKDYQDSFFYYRIEEEFGKELLVKCEEELLDK